MYEHEIHEICMQVDLNDAEDMKLALTEVGMLFAGGRMAMWFSCIDLDDPSQCYDALVHLGAEPVNQE